MRGAICGFGFIGGEGHWPAYQQAGGFDIVAVADVCGARLDAARKAIPGVRVYDSAEALLRGEPKLDFLDITTPPVDHVPIALRALEHGLHVLCEKPLACSVDEARTLMRAGRDARRTVMPCHNYTHAPVVKTLRGLLEARTLGNIRTASIATYRTTHARGVLEWDTHWRRKLALSGGGVTMDHGSHSFYVTFLLMGAYPLGISAQTFHADPEWPTTEDTLCATLRYPQGLVNVYLTWCAGVRKVIYTLHGSEGAAVIEDDDLELTVLRDGKPHSEHHSIVSSFNVASHASWFASLFQEFREVAGRGETLPQQLREAYYCVQLIEGVYRSAQQGGVEQPLDQSLGFLGQ